MNGLICNAVAYLVLKKYRVRIPFTALVICGSLLHRQRVQIVPVLGGGEVNGYLILPTASDQLSVAGCG